MQDVKTVESFGSTYADQTDAVFSLIDCRQLPPVEAAFNRLLSSLLEEAASSPDEKFYFEELRKEMTERVEDFYTVPGDLNIDLGDLGLSLEGAGNNLTEAVEQAVIKSFSSSIGNPRARGLAVHLIPLSENGEFTSFDPAYFCNYSGEYALKWGRNNLWCPAYGGSGFLNKLFPSAGE